MPDPVGRWLEKIGLGEHASSFAENNVDLDLLARLTAEDLKEIGLSVGHRRRFLDAAACLADMPSDEAGGTPASSSPQEAERRQLTVMFCDMVGSTALSQQLDPEELREVIRDYQNSVTGEITRFGGYIARYMGDGVLVYFGWPRAHEDDAERAARTGLSVMRALHSIQTPQGVPIAARAGIATGVVVVGDLVGDGAAQEEAVVGQTPNLAARLQGVAAPGQVVVSEITRALLGDLFELEHLGEHALKGLASPVAAFAVLGERSLESRFAARSAAGLLPLTGRDQELSLLLERWRRAKAGEGQVLVLSGEAGIGKSRITQALIDAVAEESHFRINYQCSPYHGASALYPAIRHLGFTAGIRPDDPADAKLDKLESVLSRAGDHSRDACMLIAALLGIDYQGRYGAMDISPEEQRNRTLQTLADELLRLTRRQPVLFVVEDAHWIDPSTLELIELLLDRIADASVLTLITARPTFEHGFGGHPIVGRLALNRLGRDDIAAIIGRITGGIPLPDLLVEEIAAKTDGVPLFVEELTKTVLGSDMLTVEDGTYTLTEAGHRLAIPSSLHDSLMARLDRLQPVKEVAQMAACIGREFSYPLLAAISPLTDAELRQALDQLIGAELIFRRGTPPHSSYTFKHALVRDAAYESLLKDKRRMFHASIAAEMARILPVVAETEPEVLARHHSAAGDIDEAIRYWALAGERSASMSSGLEACNHYQRALALLDRLAEDEPRDRRELTLRLNYAGALQLTRGPADLEVGAAFERALELSTRLDEPAQRTAALFGRVRYSFWRGGPNAARRYFGPLSEIADRSTNVADRVVADYFIGTVQVMAGEDRAGLEYAERAWELFSSGTEESLAFRLGHNQGISTLLIIAWGQWSMGRTALARSAIDRSLQLAQETSHPLTMVIVRLCAASVLELLGEERQDNVDAARALAAEYGFTLWSGCADTCLGWLKFRGGDTEEGLGLMERGTRAWGEGGCQGFSTDRLALFGRMCLDAGYIDRARSVLTEAMSCAERIGEKFWLSEIERHLGRLTLMETDDREAAETYFRRALETADARGANGFALRAAMDLAEHMRADGRVAQGKELLSRYCRRSDASDDTRDPRRARTLLGNYA